MLLAVVTSQRSSDPNTQVGACLVDPFNRIVGLGYNNPPRGISPGMIPWAREGDPLDTKYPYIVHAEKNAIFNANSPTHGCTLYVTMHPCNECAKDIIQAGIRKVVFLTNPYLNKWKVRGAVKMFDIADVELEQHEWDSNWSISHD